MVPEESYEIPYGKARILSPGKDVTIVGISHMALECVRAKHLLEAAGIDAEVIDPVSLSPLDIETIAASVERTGRLLVVDTGWLSCGASSEILSEVFERIGERRHFVASGWAICRRRARRPGSSRTCTIRRRSRSPRPPIGWCAAPSAPAWQPGKVDSSEVAEFRGPF